MIRTHFTRPIARPILWLALAALLAGISWGPAVPAYAQGSVSLGATAADVESVYGAPAEKNDYPDYGMVVWDYPASGMRAVFNSEKMILVQVQLAAPFSGSMLGVQLGWSQDQVHQALGDPAWESTRDNLTKWHYDQQGLVVVFEGGAAIQFNIVPEAGNLRARPALKATTLDMPFGIGDTRAAMEQTLGSPESTGQKGSTTICRYDSKGLVVRVSEDNVVISVSVFAPATVGISGVHIGDDKSAALAAFGEPSGSSTASDGSIVLAFLPARVTVWLTGDEISEMRAW